MAENGSIDVTKERLLDEAESLFAQRGFDGVSVREITAAARCNLAAVNYHFGNKKNLYVEVFRSRWVPRAKRLQDHFRKNMSVQGDISPGAVARALAGAFLIGPMSDEERQRHHQLMSREIGRPTEAFKLVADESEGWAEFIVPGLKDSYVALNRWALDTPQPKNEFLTLRVLDLGEFKSYLESKNVRTRGEVDEFLDENQGLRMFKFYDSEGNTLTAAQIDN